MIVALTPGLIALGAFMAIVPLLRRDSTMARSFLAIVSVALLLRYLYWRVTSTLPPPHLTVDAAIGYPFMLLEAASLVAVTMSLLFLSRTRDRTGAARIDGRATDPRAPLIDVFICTYNEERGILERTIIGACGSVARSSILAALVRSRVRLMNSSDSATATSEDASSSMKG